MSTNSIIFILLLLLLVVLSYVKKYFNNNIFSGVIIIIMLIIIVFLSYYSINNQFNYDKDNIKMDLFMKIRYYMYKLDFIKLVIMSIIFITVIIVSMIKKENMTTSTSTTKSTDPMVISQTTAGAIKTIHDTLQPIQINQDLIDQLTDAVNNQSDQIASLQTNSS